MKLDPKQIKGGTLTGNMSLTGTLSLPSLLDDTSSLTGLFIASDNSIKKRSLGTMALLSAASFYDKTTADSTFLKLTGGVMSGTLTVNSVVNIGSTLNITGSDLTIRNAARGAGGRALVHEGTNGLSINYANDFTGGVKIGSNVFFSNTASSYLMNVNFGIGTATPSEKLAVVGNISMLGMFKLNAILGTTGQFIKNTGTLSEWANITTSDITGLATYNGLTNYLPLSGGTLSGTLTLPLLTITKSPSDSIQQGPSVYLNGGTGTSYTQLQQGVGRFIIFGFGGSSWEEKMTIRHSDGFVGIGTPNPIYRLDVNGTARFTGNVNFNTHIILNNDRWIYWKDTSGADRRFLALSTNNSFYIGDIDNAISGGVNNFFANQQHNFFVNNDLKIQLTNGSNYFKGHITAYGITNAQIRTQSSDTSSIVAKMQSVDGNSVFMGAESNHYLNFITNNVIRATIDTTGNLGIGITTPSSLGLQIHKGSISAGITLSNTANNWSILTGDTTNAFIITDNQWGERIRISANGNIGLSTNVPNRKLTVYSNTADVYSSFRTASSLQEGMLFGLGTNNQGVIYNSENSPIEFYTNRTFTGTIHNNGNWGIGLYYPQTRLHVGGGYGQLNGLAIGSLDSNEYATLLFTENYENGVTHLFSLKQTVGYGDLALAEYGGRVGIGTDRPNVKLDVRGTIRIGNNGFVTGSAGSFMDIWHTSSTGNSQVNLQAWSNGGNTYDSIVLQPLSGEVRIGIPTDSYYKLNVGGTAKIDGFLRLGENLALNCNQFGYWQDSLGTDRRIIGMNAAHSIYLGDIDRTISNSNLILLANSTHWFYVGQTNIAVITSSGLDVKGNYYQNGVLKTFFDGNYNSLSNLPNLGSYVPWANVEMALNGSNWNDTNGNPISIKMVKSIVDGKSSNGHTHDYYTLTNRPNLGSYVLTSSIVQDELSVNATNSNAVAAKVLFSMKDNIYANMNAGLSGKANASHTHDWNSITGKPSLFDGNYNSLSNRPNLGLYVLTSSIVQDELSVNATNSNAVAAKVLFSMKDTIYANMNAGLSGKANASHTHDWNSITGKPSLFDGNYNNLSNRPTLFSGSYTDLSNKPVLFDGNYNNLSNKPTLFDGNYNSLINKPTLFDGNYNSLSNLPNLNNFALAANTIPVAAYSSTTSNPVSGLYTQENIIFQSMVRMNQLYVTSSATIESSLNVAGFLWCDGGIRGTGLALSNPTTLLDYQVTKTSVEGVYVKVGNNVIKLTLTQFKNLMATV